MKSIFEIFDSKGHCSLLDDVNTAMKNPMIGSQFFPNNKNNGLGLHGIKGRNQLPVALQPSCFRYTKSNFRGSYWCCEVSTECRSSVKQLVLVKRTSGYSKSVVKGIPFAQPTIARV